MTMKYEDYEKLRQNKILLLQKRMEKLGNLLHKNAGKVDKILEKESKK